MGSLSRQSVVITGCARILYLFYGKVSSVYNPARIEQQHYSLTLHSLVLSLLVSRTMRVAIVTGSNKGIGLAIVRGMCRQFDGDVYLTSRNEKLGEEAIKLLKGEGLEPKYHQLDITSEDSIAKLAVFVMEKYGGVDVLINNAGIAYKTASTAPDIEQATVTMETNFTGTLNMMRSFFPLMKPHGRIVNVSSSLVGSISRLTSKELQEKFKSLTLTEKELVSLADQFIADVREGKHKERGWGSTFYGVSKVTVTAMTKVFAREAITSGKY